MPEVRHQVEILHLHRRRDRRESPLSQSQPGDPGGRSLSLSGAGGSTATEGYLDVGSLDDGGGYAALDRSDRISYTSVDNTGISTRGPRPTAGRVDGDAGSAYGSLVPAYGQVPPAAGSGPADPEYAHLEQRDAPAYASLVPAYGQVALHSPGTTTEYSHVRPGGGDAAARQQ